MISNATVTGLPGAGTNWLSTVQTSMALLLVGVILGTLLIPFLIAILVLSTTASRKHAVFSFNILAIGLGLLAAILHTYSLVHGILSPTDPLDPTTEIAFILLMSFTPLVVEGILILRLVAIFPLRQTHVLEFCAMLALPVVFKIVRIILLSLFSQCYINGQCSIASIPAEIQDNDVRWAVVYVKMTWFLQIIDNTYVSMMFLWQLRRKQAMECNKYGSWSMQARLHGLFYIALTSYVFPLVLGVAELVLIFAAHSYMPATCVLFLDIYVSIFGVAFATIWTTGIQWLDHFNSSLGANPESSTKRSSQRLFLGSTESVRTGRTTGSRRAEEWDQDDKGSLQVTEVPMTIFVQHETTTGTV